MLFNLTYNFQFAFSHFALARLDEHSVYTLHLKQQIRETRDICHIGRPSQRLNLSNYKVI